MMSMNVQLGVTNVTATLTASILMVVTIAFVTLVLKETVTDAVMSMSVGVTHVVVLLSV